MKKTSMIKSMESTIKKICETIGPRPPCSEQEHNCAQYIRKKLGKYTETHLEEFYCHPGTYKFIMRLPFISLLIITIFYWLYYFFTNFIFLLIISIITFFTFIIIQTEITRNIELIDFLFKKKRSSNIYGVFKPNQNRNKGEIKNLIIIGGHHDSQHEFEVLRKSPLLFNIMITSSILFHYILCAIFILEIIFFLVFGLSYLMIPLIDLIILMILTFFFPFYIYSTFKIVTNRPTLGVDDNLTSVAVIIELARHLQDYGLKNTEIWLVSHGCEEIGDRGSKRFSKKHQREILDKNGLVVNIDMVAGKDSELTIDIREEVTLIRLCKELGLEISKIANDLGLKHKVGNVEAFTDSMAYSQNNIKAISLIGKPKKGFASYYHTRNDTIDKIDFGKLWDVYRIIIEFIKRKDKGLINI
ncbi:MAG: M20/M25/M40 family metallo-hydrolase [Candidatus Lokiarchaeota archaeon]|nr:M20/M25/M40 family metallo-hydrolase [Candidatus Lokiarchaeota archaeon]